MILVWVVIAVVHGLVLGVDFSTGASVLPMILISTAGLMLYYVGILTTMKTGDLSVYYPIIRASPLFIVVGGWLVLGQRYGLVMLTGVGLVMVGAFFLQYRPGARLLAQPLTFATAALAMSGMGMMSLSDSEAVRLVEPTTLLVWEYVILALACAVFFVIRKPAGRPVTEHLFGGWRVTPLRYLCAAVTSYLSYYLILVSYQMGGNVAAVTAIDTGDLHITHGASHAMANQDARSHSARASLGTRQPLPSGNIRNRHVGERRILRMIEDHPGDVLPHCRSRVLAGDLERLERIPGAAAEVRKTPSWPKSWANFSLL